jgi:hypothetical protein
VVFVAVESLAKTFGNQIRSSGKRNIICCYKAAFNNDYSWAGFTNETTACVADLAAI